MMKHHLLFLTGFCSILNQKNCSVFLFLIKTINENMDWMQTNSTQIFVAFLIIDITPQVKYVLCVAYWKKATILRQR